MLGQSASRAVAQAQTRWIVCARATIRGASADDLSKRFIGTGAVVVRAASWGWGSSAAAAASGPASCLPRSSQGRFMTVQTGSSPGDGEGGEKTDEGSVQQKQLNPPVKPPVATTTAMPARPPAFTTTGFKRNWGNVNAGAALGSGQPLGSRVGAGFGPSPSRRGQGVTPPEGTPEPKFDPVRAFLVKIDWCLSWMIVFEKERSLLMLVTVARRLCWKSLASRTFPRTALLRFSRKRTARSRSLQGRST